MKQPLKQQLQHHFTQIALGDPQLDDLDKLIISKPEEISNPSRFVGANLAAIGIFLVAVVTIFMISQLPINASKNMPRLIAEEVVKNHLKLKPLEVEAGTISAIRGYFSKLDFMPVDSRMAMREGTQLLGGRYCSLQGITAAQLRMKQGDNLQTLYQTQYLPDVFGHLPQIEKGEVPLVVYAKGIKVKIWVEKGLVLALADSSSANDVVDSIPPEK